MYIYIYKYILIFGCVSPLLTSHHHISIRLSQLSSRACIRDNKGLTTLARAEKPWKPLPQKSEVKHRTPSVIFPDFIWFYSLNIPKNKVRDNLQYLIVYRISWLYV